MEDQVAMADMGELVEEDGSMRGLEDPEERRVFFCALDSFNQYAKVCHFNCTHIRRQSFYALPQAHWSMLAQPPFTYLSTLDRVDEAIESNAELARLIVKYGMLSFRPSCSSEPDWPTIPAPWAGIAKFQDIDKARSTIRQFYRDWTAEGAEERRICYGPVKQALAEEYHRDGLGVAAAGAPTKPKVLVPGAGLGRLVLDLCADGYEVEGNEISYHQLLASSYILNYAERVGQHTIYPWVHSFSNHGTRQDQFRGYAVPDVLPAQVLAAAGPGAGSMSMCAADFLCLYGDEEHRDAYDAVATVFFLDTAPNLIRYLETILHCLKPGGILVNFGPLLWHFENNAPGNHGLDDDGDGMHDAASSSGIADPGSFELTDEEVMLLVEKLGFIVLKRETGITAPYIQDFRSMLQTTYKASSWVARKPVA